MNKAILALPFALAACGITPSGSLIELDTKSVPARRATVIADGCTLDSWQLETLESYSAKAVIDEVVLLCLVPHADGTVGPSDGSAQSDLSGVVGRLQSMGYRVTLGASFVTDNGYVFDGNETANELESAAWIDEVASAIASLAASADGVDLDLEQLPARARADVTRLVATLSPKLRPKRQLSVFLPPSTVSPSDVPGGDAFDVASLSAYVDRFRVMTLDYSGAQPGPTIDSGWAVDAVRFAQQSTAPAAVDVAFPLYGNDFTLSSTEDVRLTTYLEARGLADAHDVIPERSATQELILDWTDDQKRAHELWYDDADSTLVTLGAWSESTLPISVGVVFYGFGAEDPALWDALARAEQ